MAESDCDMGHSSTGDAVRVSFPNARVLIVDDVPANLMAVRAMLKPCGMRVDCVNSGQKALDIVSKGDVAYDAIFMDHLMPEMDGIETVKKLRGEIGTDYAKTVPVIALTANTDDGTARLFLENGFQDFLSKPVDIAALDAVLLKWLGKKQIKKRRVGSFPHAANA